MLKDPSLTIAIPTYNRAEKVSALVQSILPQLCPGDELLVVDDCSTDNTQQKLAQFSALRSHRQPQNQGMVRNWNSCLRLAQNEWVCIVHDDDVVSENAVATLRETCAVIRRPALIAQPWRIPASYGGYHYHVYSPGPGAVMASGLSPSGAVVHKTLYEQVGGFDERFTYSADVEYFARLAAHYPLVIVEAPALVTYQVHESNYQYETWRKHDFWPQWKQITHAVLSYAGLDENTLSRIDKEQTANILFYIMQSASKRHDTATLRRYGKIALAEQGKRLRLRGLVAAMLGRYW